jgi:hypothetical protein
MMPELLPAFDGAIFAAAHILGCPTGQAPVLGNTAGRGRVIFMLRFHRCIFETVSKHITVVSPWSKDIPPLRSEINFFFFKLARLKNKNYYGLGLMVLIGKKKGD